MLAFLVKWCILKFRFVKVQHVKLSVGPGFSLTLNSINHNHEIVIPFKVSEVFFPLIFQSFMSPVCDLTNKCPNLSLHITHGR